MRRLSLLRREPAPHVQFALVTRGKRENSQKSRDMELGHLLINCVNEQVPSRISHSGAFGQGKETEAGYHGGYWV